MQVRNGFIETIGNTPLIRLRRASEMTGCEILGKAEFLNPGGSVKDRAALFIVEITLEANPTSVEAARFADLRAAGVNRVSLGVQALIGLVWVNTAA